MPTATGPATLCHVRREQRPSGKCEVVDVLNGHDFSRAVSRTKSIRPLGSEGCFSAVCGTIGPSSAACLAPAALSGNTASRSREMMEPLNLDPAVRPRLVRPMPRNPCQIAGQNKNGERRRHQHCANPEPPIAMHTHPVRAGARFTAVAAVSCPVVLVSRHFVSISPQHSSPPSPLTQNGGPCKPAYASRAYEPLDARRDSEPR